ncbi:N/A [soil metagenome]
MSAGKDLVTALAGVPVFARCTRRELKAVARHTETVDLEAGEELMAQGAAGDALFVLLRGRAEVTVDGSRVTELGPGNYVGELALLDGEPRSATVRTTTPAVVAVLGRRMFHTLLRELPELSEQLLAGLASELRQARDAGHQPPESANRADGGGQP